MRTRSNHRSFSRFVPLALLISGFIAFIAMGLDSYLSFGTLQSNRTFLIDTVDKHVVYTAVVFVICFTLISMCMLPGTALMGIVGGFLFGPVTGTLLSSLSVSIAAMAIYLAVKTAFEDLLHQKAGPRLEQISNGISKHGIKYQLFVMFLPLIPLAFVSIAAGLIGSPFRKFMIVFVIGSIPLLAIFTNFGSGLGAILDADHFPDASVILNPQIFLPLLVLTALTLLAIGSVLSGRKAKTRKRQ